MTGGGSGQKCLPRAIKCPLMPPRVRVPDLFPHCIPLLIGPSLMTRLSIYRTKHRSIICRNLLLSATNYVEYPGISPAVTGRIRWRISLSESSWTSNGSVSRMSLNDMVRRVINWEKNWAPSARRIWSRTSVGSWSSCIANGR